MARNEQLAGKSVQRPALERKVEVLQAATNVFFVREDRLQLFSGALFDRGKGRGF